MTCKLVLQALRPHAVPIRDVAVLQEGVPVERLDLVATICIAFLSESGLHLAVAERGLCSLLVAISILNVMCAD
jgi:hypothetical protein